MKLKTYQEVKKYNGYIGIDSHLEKDNDHQYVESDIFYTELGRVSKALYLNNDGIPCYQLIHLGGAFLSGEQYLTDINVQENTHIIVTSQAATKVNRTRSEDDASRYICNVELSKNSILEFINDAIILYPQSRYEQINNFNLDASSTLIYCDIVSPGYGGSTDQMYQYDELFMQSEIKVNNKLILFDKLYYNPKLQCPNNDGVMDGYERCANILFISPLINEQTSQEIYDLIAHYKFDFKFEFGVSEFYNKAIGIRILSNQIYEIERIFELVHTYIRENYLHLEKLKLRKQHVH